MTKRDRLRAPMKRRPGRPKAADKTEHVVAFRLTSAELEAAERETARAKLPSVNALAKTLLLERTGNR